MVKVETTNDVGTKSETGHESSESSVHLHGSTTCCNGMDETTTPGIQRFFIVYSQCLECLESATLLLSDKHVSTRSVPHYPTTLSMLLLLQLLS